MCGKKYDIKIEVPGKIVYIVLYSDYEATEQGFTANYQAVTPAAPPMKGT